MTIFDARGFDGDDDRSLLEEVVEQMTQIFGKLLEIRGLSAEPAMFLTILSNRNQILAQVAEQNEKLVTTRYRKEMAAYLREIADMWDPPKPTIIIPKNDG